MHDRRKVQKERGVHVAVLKYYLYFKCFFDSKSSMIFPVVTQNCGKCNATEKTLVIILQDYMKEGYKNPTK